MLWRGRADALTGHLGAGSAAGGVPAADEPHRLHRGQGQPAPQGAPAGVRPDAWPTACRRCSTAWPRARRCPAGPRRSPPQTSIRRRTVAFGDVPRHGAASCRLAHGAAAPPPRADPRRGRRGPAGGAHRGGHHRAGCARVRAAAGRRARAAGRAACRPPPAPPRAVFRRRWRPPRARSDPATPGPALRFAGSARGHRHRCAGAAARAFGSTTRRSGLAGRVPDGELVGVRLHRGRHGDQRRQRRRVRLGGDGSRCPPGLGSSTVKRAAGSAERHNRDVHLEKPSTEGRAGSFFDAGVRRQRRVRPPAGCSIDGGSCTGIPG